MAIKGVIKAPSRASSELHQWRRQGRLKGTSERAGALVGRGGNELAVVLVVREHKAEGEIAPEMAIKLPTRGTQMALRWHSDGTQMALR